MAGGAGGVNGGASGSAAAGASGLGGTSAGGTAPAGSGGQAAGGVDASGGSSGGGAPSGGGGAGGGSGGGPVAGGAGGSGVMSMPSDLPVPPGDGGMPRPSGAPGNLTVLSWAGFQGAASFTFDDTNSSQISNYDTLNGLGVPFTFYLITGKNEMNDPVWATAVSDGHEIGNHTVNHLAQATAAEIDDATALLESKLGITVFTMAAPMGDLSYASFAQTRFLINRGVSNSVIMPKDNSDPFNLPCYIPNTGASSNDMGSQIDSAESAGGWRVVLVHGFTGGSDGAYQPVGISEFTAAVEHAKSLGDVWIDTVANVGAYWRAEKLVAALTPETQGDDQVWSWTLPDHFPPGRFLRVTVDGGTLKQGGSELGWNDHGYYEIALDAGSVTLSP